ncbi:hypothetical protein J1N09_15265 [Aureitalea sp. L0-47]|uniref:hypothetical protein n=1 Tax=Aureitalea sp. L0-47 TaxID=2816962 RepID=UPI0022389EBD|nr:hypothetical protein [Aureitalea sp. L0-47]MCW5521203.1 hypothetical protein [Aureitalea sp. L0-47]
MKKILLYTMISFSYLWSMDLGAQVAIGTETLDNGAIFQMESSNKGLLIPRVALTDRTDDATIDPAQVEGLWVYNTATAGSGNDRVSPGMYFWDGDEWIRIYNRGYSEQFFQTALVRPQDQTTEYTLTGLDQEIIVPITGTYQVIVNGAYGTGLKPSGSNPAVGTCSIWLEIDNVKVDEMWLTSTSKVVGSSGAFHALQRSGMFIYNVDLEAGTSYDFVVKAREWDERNSYSNFSGWGYGFWGLDSSRYNGNNSGVNGVGRTDAHMSYMTITLLRQF